MSTVIIIVFIIIVLLLVMIFIIRGRREGKAKAVVDVPEKPGPEVVDSTNDSKFRTALYRKLFSRLLNRKRRKPKQIRILLARAGVL